MLTLSIVFFHFIHCILQPQDFCSVIFMTSFCATAHFLCLLFPLFCWIACLYFLVATVLPSNNCFEFFIRQVSDPHFWSRLLKNCCVPSVMSPVLDFSQSCRRALLSWHLRTSHLLQSLLTGLGEKCTLSSLLGVLKLSGTRSGNKSPPLFLLPHMREF